MNTKSGRLFSAALAPIVGLLLASAPTTSDAIPAWSRKYKVPCSSCHFGGTYKLTKFGRDFMWRGFRTADAEGLEVDEALDALKFTDYFSFSQSFSYTVDPDSNVDTSFRTNRLGITGGGPLYDNFSFLLGYTLAPSAGISNGHLEYNTDHAADSYLFARAGLLSPEMFTLQFLGRPSITGGNVGGGITSSPSSSMNGITVGYRTKGNTILEAGYVNGANSTATGADDSNHKDVFLTVEQWIDDEGSNVGAYYVNGKARVPASTNPVNPAWEMDYDRMGIMGSFMRENFTIEGGWFTGNNDLQGGGSREPTGFYVGGAYNFNPDLTGFVTYEDFDRELVTSPVIPATSVSRTKTLSFGAQQRIRQIGRIQGTVSLTDETQINGQSSSRTVYQISLGWLF
jgi:hypothetical protein